MELTRDAIDADIDIFDGLDSVTVLEIDPDSGATLSTATGVTVLKRAEEKTEVPADEGGVPVTTTKFHLRASSLSFVPKERDQIVDDSTTWVVGKVTKAAFATRYVCDVTKLPG
jgi:hypothetical protein